MPSPGDPALIDFLRSIALFGALSDDSLRRIEAMLVPREFFGEMSLIEIQPRSATVRVVEPALLYSMTNRDLYSLYGQDLSGYILLLQNICRQLARRLRKSDSRLSELLGLIQNPSGG